MASLFDIVNDEAGNIEKRLDELEKEGVPYADAIEQAISEANDIRADKALSYAKAILNLEALGESCKAASIRMGKRGQARLNLASRLRARMEELLEPEFTIEDEEVKVSFRKSLSLDDSKLDKVEDVPKEFRTVIPETWKLDKVKAKNVFTQRIKELGKDPDPKEVEQVLRDTAVDMGGLTLKEKNNIQIK